MTAAGLTKLPDAAIAAARRPRGAGRTLVEHVESWLRHTVGMIQVGCASSGGTTFAAQLAASGSPYTPYTLNS